MAPKGLLRNPPRMDSPSFLDSSDETRLAAPGASEGEGTMAGCEKAWKAGDGDINIPSLLPLLLRRLGVVTGDFGLFANECVCIKRQGEE